MRSGGAKASAALHAALAPPDGFLHSEQLCTAELGQIRDRGASARQNLQGPAQPLPVSSGALLKTF